MDVDMWASLPTDMLLDIFRRLDASDLIRCTCTCKPWRDTIIDNAWSLHPRPDCFNPNLLLGFFQEYCYNGHGKSGVPWQCVPGPFESVLMATTGGYDPERLSSFIPAASAGGVDLSIYDSVLSSRDGFLLLDGLDVNDLCLCNPLTGDCTFLPEPAFVQPHTYVLVTGYDLDDGQGVQIVAMEGESIHGFQRVRYQLLYPNASAGKPATWGPVKCSLDFNRRLGDYMMLDGAQVICHGAIHWLGELINGNPCVLALDVRTGRTWTIEAPEECLQNYLDLVLTTSRDGRISLLSQQSRRWIHVWVLIDSDRWMLWRKIHVPKFNNCLNEVFCARSGWVLADVGKHKELLIDIDRGSTRRITNPYAKDPDADADECRHPYEMDWSTYLSRMKHF